MRIIVPIKQVPETSSVRMDEQTGTMVRDGVEAIVNPLDLYAIETALRLRDARGGRVTCLSMGPPAAERALREALSMGCDDAALLSDSAFAGSDTWATSYALAAAVRKLGACDLILCGERATDGDTGQVGPGIAAWLNLPVVTYVGRVERVGEGRIRVRRLVEAGCEILDAALPCVLTVVKAIAAPRLPTLRGKQRARTADVPRWGPGDPDVDADKLGLSGSPTRVVNIFRPTVARQCELLPAGDAPGVEAAAERFAAFLREKELL
ncbi:MAG: electron transfer flavoprotein subunit beta/FixA family protein [Phycisphaerae bacterium]|nr:electron transfer flavoprotein subunit beta/FixA family protein [Phycisphaerae bacterium]